MELDQLTVLLILSDPNFYEWMAGVIALQSGLQVTAEQCLQYVQLAAQSGDQLAQQLIMQYIQAYTLVRSAAAGTKLDYISRLRGKCPAGYQILYYKQGGKGRICKKCVKKKATGGVMSNDFTVGTTGENAVNTFKKAFAYKNGGSMIPKGDDGLITRLINAGKEVMKTYFPGAYEAKENNPVVIQGGDIVGRSRIPEGYKKTTYTDENGGLYVEEIIPGGLYHKTRNNSWNSTNLKDPLLKEEVDTFYHYPYNLAGYDVDLASPEKALKYGVRAKSYKRADPARKGLYIYYDYPMIRDLVREKLYGE